MAERSLDEPLERLATLVAGKTLEMRPSSTIEPERHDSASRAVEVLNRLAGEVRLAGELELERTLGEGGMGIVRLATQKSLGRKVAVKTLRAEHRNPQATVRMLTEAWVTGSLEHPNVVPVYDVALDSDGSPVIVLKRIEGTSWEDVMDEPAELRRRFRASDPLEWNLGVLMQVCTAAHFAHSRGIIHRDYKPANVMLGEFGEVYVLDWGIAVSLKDDGSGRIPLAADAGDLAGTPSYMAPEMLDGHGRRLSPRTDVYLLGGILYQILTGEPPHQGATFAELVSNVMRSQPAIPDDVPAELARIVRRALDADPDARFETPEQLRLALMGYLQRRGATRLGEQADRRLDLLLADLAKPDARTRRLTVYSLFSECRFGYREALAAWQGNQAAQRGLMRAIAAMVDYELAAGDARAAAALIADVDEVPADLRGRVHAALVDQDAEDARLARLAADHDPKIGQVTRGRAAITLTAIWAIAPLAAALAPAGWETRTIGVLIPIAFLVAMVILGISTGGRLLKTAFNRNVSLATMLMTVAMVAGHGVAHFLGLTVAQTYALHYFTWFLLGGMLAITVEKWFTPSTIGYLVGALVVARRPDLAYWMMVPCNGLLAMTVLWLWHPSGRKPCDVMET